VTKYVNELYADVFSRSYGFNCIGLRYFNVFGPRQDPNGAYAAVIPKWSAAMIKGESVIINGDGETSRDFCFVANAVQANLLAACIDVKKSEVFNVAVGDRSSLNELFNLIRKTLIPHGIKYDKDACYFDFREGDVKHSQADISKAEQMLGYEPKYNLYSGLVVAMSWYLSPKAKSVLGV